MQFIGRSSTSPLQPASGQEQGRGRSRPAFAGGYSSSCPPALCRTEGGSRPRSPAGPRCLGGAAIASRARGRRRALPTALLAHARLQSPSDRPRVPKTCFAPCWAGEQSPKVLPLPQGLGRRKPQGPLPDGAGAFHVSGRKQGSSSTAPSGASPPPRRGAAALCSPPS